MARKELTLETREVTGKKVAALRRVGIVPGNIFGRHLESLSVQLPAMELIRTLRASAKNEVIDLKVAGEKSARPAVIHGVQRDPVNGAILHADFYQVSLREKMRADVPLVLVGTSEAVSTYNGVLTQPADSIHVEALPLDIPAHIEVDVSSLTELDTSIHVSDLQVPSNVTVLTNPDVVVASVAAPRIEAELAAEAEEAAAAAEEAEAAVTAEVAPEEQPEAPAGEESQATE